MTLTHGVEVVKHVVHADDLVVELIVCAGVGQERVPKRDEQVEDVDNLSAQEIVASYNLRTSKVRHSIVSGLWAVGFGQKT